MKKGLRTKLFAWWYFSIAAGFCLLGVRQWLFGESFWPVLLRFAISAGFVLLGFLALRYGA